jgi:exopolyphosphatase/guanosine-5'-triphosphate,3'-diphosphate pyrophosphatase
MSVVKNLPKPTAVPIDVRSPKKQAGLGLWMQTVLQECDRAGVDFAPDPVHDLRVALRRCRSVADSFMLVDPNPAWKQMKKAGRQVFRSLGDLRDVQVMKEWLLQLFDGNDHVAVSLAQTLSERESRLKLEAAKALPEFDRKQWLKWSSTLPRLVEKIRKGSAVFRNLALERYEDAHRLHQVALRNRSKVAFHNLRIGLKRFRYTVENCLPEQHEAWKADLKEMQDLLGEVHDLDVLWTSVLQAKVFADPEARTRWRARIAEERIRRINRYREKMLGKAALWQVWRSALPQGDQIEESAQARLKIWASALDPQFAHSLRVCRIALLLYDSFPSKQTESDSARQRAILQAASLLHNVGLSKTERKHHKASYRLILRIRAYPGYDAQFLRMSAGVARYHRGALPRTGHAGVRQFSAIERQQVARLAGILRLASALDTAHNGEFPSLEIAERGSLIVISVTGYSPFSKGAESIAAARHLLESVSGRPIIIKSAAASKSASAPES